MVSVVSKELHFDEELKKKIEFICDFWKELDQQYIVDGILALNDKKYVKDLLDTKWLYFLTSNSERKN